MARRKTRDPMDLIVGRTYLTSVFGCDSSYVTRLVERRVISREGVGEYHLFTAVHEYITHLRGKSKEHEESDKSRLMKAKADLAEIEARQAAGSLVPVDNVSQVWTELAMNFRARMLSIPSKVAPLVAPEVEIEVCHALIEQMVLEALEELSADVNSLLHLGGADPANPESHKAPAEKKTKRVGRPRKKAVL